MKVPTYRARFGPKEAERLLWRAGFGPKPGQSRRLARKGLRRAVYSLTRPRPKRAKLKGPKPLDEDGRPLAPRHATGHDHLSWLDRMVRSTQPTAERMTLVWHDWFATGSVNQPALGLKQIRLFRKHALGSFEQLLLRVTKDPAMLVWLSGDRNTKWSPNENYARELMELFTLGADAGYTETDVREQARALTGWTKDYDEIRGSRNFRFDPDLHDTGVKSILGQRGRFDWADSCRLCLDHPAHDDFFVRKLWSYFIPTDPPRKTLRALKRMYRKGYRVRPLVEAILMHPDLYEGPRMIKPPIVQIAGMLRARGTGVRSQPWIWTADHAGQRLFAPPNVAGWDDERWLDTARISGRWASAANAIRQEEVEQEGYDAGEGAQQAVRKALRFWGNPTIGKATHRELMRFARQVEGAPTAEWHEWAYRALRQNALRIMIVTSPDFLTS